MGKSAKKPESTTCNKIIPRQTSLNSFFSKQPRNAQPKLFSQVLPTKRIPSAPSSKKPEPSSADDDDSDFKPTKKRKSPNATLNLPHKIHRGKVDVVEGKARASAIRPRQTEASRKDVTSQSPEFKKLDVAKKTTSRTPPENQQIFSITSKEYEYESCKLGLTEVSPATPASHSVNNSNDMGCFSPKSLDGKSTEVHNKDAKNEILASPITIIPETPDAHHISDTRSQIFRSAHDDLTPTGKPSTTFVPETPESASNERCTNKSKHENGAGFHRGRTNLDKKMERRKLSQRGKLSAFSLLGISPTCNVQKKAESTNLLTEMLEEFSRSNQSPGDVKRLSSGHKCLPNNSRLNPFKVGTTKTELLSEITEDHVVKADSPKKRMSTSHERCDQDSAYKQDVDPLAEFLQEYTSSLSPMSVLSERSGYPSKLTVDSNMKPLREPFRDRQIVQAKRPLSKLSRTGRKKLGSGASPVKTICDLQTKTRQISLDRFSQQTERDLIELDRHCGAVSSSSDKEDFVCRDRLISQQSSRREATGSYLLDVDLLSEGSKTKLGNPFTVRPAPKLKVLALPKTGGNTHSKMSAFKTKLNTRKRSVSKGNSPCAKRISASNLSAVESPLFQESEILPRKEILATGTVAKKSLFQEEKENVKDVKNLKGSSPRHSEVKNSPHSERTSASNLSDVETSLFESILPKDIIVTGTTAKKSLFHKEQNLMDLEKVKDWSLGCSATYPRTLSNKTNTCNFAEVAAIKGENSSNLGFPSKSNASKVGVQDLEKASCKMELSVPMGDSSEHCLASSQTCTFDSVWEDQLSDSELAALDMGFEEPQLAGPQEGLDSLESEVTKNFSLLSPFKASKGKDEPTLPTDLNRYKVTGVQDRGCEKVLKLRCLTEHKDKTCTLKGTWLSTLVNEGDTVAVHGSFDASGMCTIDQQNNFLVVHPDRLITGTNVSRSIKCMRRSVLSEKFKGMDTASKAMLLGTILHEVFDKAIERKEFSENELLKIVDKVSHQLPYLKDMYAVGMTEQNVLDESQEYVGPMKQWAEKYLQPCPKQSAAIDVKMPWQQQPEKCTICVSQVKEIEETVWSPRWGIKGKVDLTVEVKIHQRKARGKKSLMTLPLELKTGRETNSIEHRSQLVLYSLMLGDIHHHESVVDLGLLLYLKTGAMVAVPANHMDKRELVHLRNQLAYYIAQRVRPLDEGLWLLPELPPPIEDDFACKYCPHLVSCSTLQRIKSDMGAGHQLSERGSQFFADQISHLTQRHMDYFNHWYLLCALEGTAAESRNQTKHIWLKEAKEREMSSGGECLSGLVLAGCSHNKSWDIYSITFKRAVCHSTSSILNFQVSRGDRVAVSVEKSRRIATCTGFVESVGQAEITIRSERPLHSKTGTEVYRMDKDDAYNTMASSLVSLAKLTQNEESAFRLRKLVVELTEPEFDVDLQIPDTCKSQVSAILESLNCDQQKAIDAVQRSRDYTLIIGMPGTGKTTTIVALVRILCACGQSVLLTSYTHSAVDNILLKLIKFGVSPLRLGEEHRMHPDVTPYSEREVLGKAKTVQQLASLFETKLVVATTCLGAKHVTLSKRVFDVCIVDEASQVSQLVCLGPLFRARRFVLVGDHKQLPPLVQSNEARKLGMDESLFQRLGVQHESTAAVHLCLQYRMNSDIMFLSNSLVYDGRLQCGNDDVAMATLSLPKWESFRKKFCFSGDDESWLTHALQPETKVCFLDTKKIKHPENLNEKHTINTAEAVLVKHLVQCLLKCGCVARHIGIISPYRNQCKLLASMVDEQIEVNTVDKYQGRDKEVIVVSFTAKDREAETSYLLQDMRRLNVALTRAKHKLILIGCIPTLRKNEPMERLVDCLQTSNFIVTLPSDACQSCGIHH